MKLIDEKGKLFGIINIIDLTVLVVIVALVCGGGYMVLGGKVNRGVSKSDDMKDVYVTISCRLISESAALALKQGDKMIAKNAYTDGTIDSVTYKTADYIGVNAEGYAVVGPHPLWKDAMVVIKDRVNVKDPILKVGTQEMRIGYKVFVKTQLVEIQGTVEKIEFR